MLRVRCLRTSVPLFQLTMTFMNSLRTFIPLFASNHHKKDQFVTNKVPYVRNDYRNAFKEQIKGTNVRKGQSSNPRSVILHNSKGVRETANSRGRKGGRDPAESLRTRKLGRSSGRVSGSQPLSVVVLLTPHRTVRAVLPHTALPIIIHRI